jgi:hypothetical protein
MNNFSPGITPVNYSNSIMPASTMSPLMGMLHQLIQRKLGVSTIGNNGVRIDPGSQGFGFTDALGNYHPNSPGV